MFLFSAILGLYYSWFQFDAIVIGGGWENIEEAKTIVMGILFVDVFSVIGLTATVVGVSILLKDKSERS